MQTALSFSTRSYTRMAHFWKRLKESPLLLGWLLAGLLVTGLQDGWTGLLWGLVNLLLLGAYVVLIRAMTPGQPAPMPVRRPHLELAAALAVLGLLFAVQLLDFGVWTVQPWQAWVSSLFAQVKAWVYGLGLPDWLQPAAFGAVSSTLKQLLPTLMVFWLLGYRRQAMGLVWSVGRLTAVLVGITAAFGIVSGVLMRAPLEQVLTWFGIGFFINALPEELFFRGMLLPRLEKVFTNPLNALVISALLFNTIHLPLAVSQGETWLTAIVNMFRTDYPTGLLWGYLYLRTRSILPGMLWHAANSRLGFLFIDL